MATDKAREVFAELLEQEAFRRRVTEYVQRRIKGSARELADGIFTKGFMKESSLEKLENLECVFDWLNDLFEMFAERMSGEYIGEICDEFRQELLWAESDKKDKEDRGRP